MPLGTQRRFDLKYAFEVRFDFIGQLYFSTCSEPAATFGEATLWQGGSLIPIKEPTRLTFNDITLERGMSRDVEIWDWFESTGDAVVKSGQAGRGAAVVKSPFTKRNGTIYQKDRTGAYVEAIGIANAYPKEYSAGDFSNDADEFRIERLVISYDYFFRAPIATE